MHLYRRYLRFEPLIHLRNHWCDASTFTILSKKTLAIFLYFVNNIFYILSLLKCVVNHAICYLMSSMNHVIILYVMSTCCFLCLKIQLFFFSIDVFLLHQETCFIEMYFSKRNLCTEPDMTSVIITSGDGILLNRSKKVKNMLNQPFWHNFCKSVSRDHALSEGLRSWYEEVWYFRSQLIWLDNWT